MRKSDLDYLRICIEVSKRSKLNGNTPFGAIIVDKEGNIIVEQENNELSEHKCTGHAETQAMEIASKKFDKNFLWQCTLYTTFEPCAMCSGAIYWGNVGKVVYGLSEEKLLFMTGDNEINPTFSLPCREIFQKGQKNIEVVGPFEELEDEILSVHEGYWK